MIIQSERVWIGSQFIPAQIEIENEKIRRICPPGTHTADVDYGDKAILPGFIDLHTHGSYGYDTNAVSYTHLDVYKRQITHRYFQR